MSFIALKEEISNAIKQILEGDLPLAEPVNPIQLFIMDYLKNNMAQKNTNLELLQNKERDDMGKFV